MSFIVNPDSIKGWEVHEGIIGKVVAEGEKMTAMMSYWKPGSVFSVHVHPHEQVGIVLQGEAVFTIDGEEYIVKKGEVYTIPSNVPHAERNESDETVVFLECFSPVRDDLLKRRFEQKVL